MRACVCLIYFHMSSSHEMKRAFKFWTDAADLRITETTGTTDIVIRFENGDHGDGYPFDGQGIFLYYEYELAILFTKSQFMILDNHK